MFVKNLEFKHHKQAPYFFKGLTFHLESGKIHALHGKNGSGKTVLLNILSGQTSKGSFIQGEISLTNVALVNQKFDHIIADQFTFTENLQFGQIGYFPNPFAPLKKNFQSFSQLLEKFHIDPHLPAHKLSGGQRQILALLMKLQKKTSVLLLDEPTATLDEQNAQMVFEFLQTLKEITLLIVCHDRELINSFTNGKHLYLERDLTGLRTLREID